MDNTNNYSFIIKYLGATWGMLNSIKLTIYDKSNEYRPSRYPLKKQEGVQGVSETIHIKIPVDEIKKIIELRYCKLQVFGDNMDLVYFFNESLIDNLETFYNTVEKNINSE